MQLNLNKYFAFNCAWNGFYMYDLASFDNYILGTVPFKLNLEINCWGKVTGTVYDDERKGGQPEHGFIKGKYKNNKIEFLKIMPTGYHYDAQGNMIELNKIGKYMIYYQGIYDIDYAEFYGIWIIQQRNVRAMNKTGGIDETMGTWKMQREV